MEQEKYNEWKEKKKETAGNESKREAIEGEMSILNPKQNSREVRKLSEHSLTRMTKRSFKPKVKKESAIKTKS